MVYTNECNFCRDFSEKDASIEKFTIVTSSFSFFCIEDLFRQKIMIIDGKKI